MDRMTMSSIGQLYTCGVWKVKPGMAPDFIEAWQSFAKWTGTHQPGALQALLLQDENDPEAFLSFSPWESADNVAEWRSRPEFEAFVTKVHELCDDFEPRTMKLVGDSEI